MPAPGVRSPKANDRRRCSQLWPCGPAAHNFSHFCATGPIPIRLLFAYPKDGPDFSRHETRPKKSDLYFTWEKAKKMGRFSCQASFLCDDSDFMFIKINT